MVICTLLSICVDVDGGLTGFAIVRVHGRESPFRVGLGLHILEPQLLRVSVYSLTLNHIGNWVLGPPADDIRELQEADTLPAAPIQSEELDSAEKPSPAPQMRVLRPRGKRRAA